MMEPRPTRVEAVVDADRRARDAARQVIDDEDRTHDRHRHRNLPSAPVPGRRRRRRSGERAEQPARAWPSSSASSLLAGVAGGWPLLVMIAAIVVMIFLHELGHYLTAKWAGMKVTEFFIGFGPRIWSFQRGETEYGIKAIPAAPT